MNTTMLYVFGVVAFFGAGTPGLVFGVVLIALAASLDAWPPDDMPRT